MKLILVETSIVESIDLVSFHSYLSLPLHGPCSLLFPLPFFWNHTGHIAVVLAPELLAVSDRIVICTRKREDDDSRRVVIVVSLPSSELIRGTALAFDVVGSVLVFPDNQGLSWRGLPFKSLDQFDNAG